MPVYLTRQSRDHLHCLWLYYPEHTLTNPTFCRPPLETRAKHISPKYSQWMLNGPVKRKWPPNLKKWPKSDPISKGYHHHRLPLLVLALTNCTLSCQEELNPCLRIWFIPFPLVVRPVSFWLHHKSARSRPLLLLQCLESSRTSNDHQQVPYHSST